MGIFRLLLAISVLCGHASGQLHWHGTSFFGLKPVPGTLAVQYFFMISGFYMALILTEKYIGKQSYFVFIQQRFLRLYPAYYVIILFTLIVEGLVSLRWPCGIWAEWPLHGGLLTTAQLGVLASSNLVIFGQDSIALALPDPHTGIVFEHFLVDSPSWTIAVELTFYLIAPMIVRQSVRIQGLIFLGFLTSRILVYLLLPDYSRWIYYFAPLTMIFFTAGSLGYQCYRNYRAQIEAMVASFSWIPWAFGILTLAYGRLPIPGDLLYYFFLPMTACMIPILFAATMRYPLRGPTDLLSSPIPFICSITPSSSFWCPWRMICQCTVFFSFPFAS